MRAVVIRDFGAEPEVAELPTPVPGDGEVLVRMHAAGVNPFDWKVIDGALKDVVPHRFPLVLGSDGAGVVDAVGPGVGEFHVGDRVFGQFMGVARGAGSYAECAVTPATKLALLPDVLAFTAAAALPTSSAAAYQAVQAAALRLGTTVVVNGASGGVGQSVVQFATAAGARVVATAPPDLAGYMRALGASEVVDFTAGPTVAQVVGAHPDGVDVVIDLVSRPGDGGQFASAIRTGGVYVSTNNAADDEALVARDVRGVNLDSRVTRADLDALAASAAQGKLKVRIDEEVALDDVPQMIVRARHGQARGKIVIVI